ncbi:integrase [Novosphingobium sp. ERN07]|uniref:tyrosine-type recombinase/integrase n=1 Tax=Novosphingobium sp. ERN07 TaxID=2726187 RepID=UPI001456365C|nr:integrase [Novosphingobium sp. ERN07]NLR69260.1 integrase [Novosphingobium sp. ERN07]
MTRLSLQEIVAGALAEVGLASPPIEKGQGSARTTIWFPGERGIGLRQYESGRKMYVVQARMSGRLRTVTLGSANVLTRHLAITVGRRVLARALVGQDPAETRLAARTSPTMDDFMGEYWEKCSPGWKPSTVATCTNYRKSHIDGAFPDLFIDTLSEEQVVRWFVSLTDRAGPAAANRCIDILHAALNKAEAWGYRAENSNPCRDVRRNKRIHRKRFLSVEELGRLGSVLLERRASPDGMVQTYASAITLLILTGCRVGEILALKWSDIRGLRAHLRDGKAGPELSGLASLHGMFSTPSRAIQGWTMCSGTRAISAR